MLPSLLGRQFLGVESILWLNKIDINAKKFNKSLIRSIEKHKIILNKSVKCVKNIQ